MPLSFSSPVTAVAGVGPKKAAALQNMGIFNVYDLLHHFPRAYQNRGDTKTLLEAALLHEKCSMVLTVGSRAKTVLLKNRKTMTKVTLFDETGRCSAIYFNQNYIASIFNVGEVYRFFGKVEQYRNEYHISSPDFEPISSHRPLPDLYPVYPLSAGLSQKVMQNIIGTTLAALDEIPSDIIPEAVRERAGICSFRHALYSIHKPSSIKELEIARNYFTFEEFFIFSAGVYSSQRLLNFESAPIISPSKELMESFYRALPFTLTDAQLRAVGDTLCDLKKGTPMHRLIQGDVGSGKTVCAAAAAYAAVKSGYQCAIMAPTEILARQHYSDLSSLFEKLGIKVSLLVGSLTAAKKKVMHEECKNGSAQLVIGTHALISQGVKFKDLALVITDEQHRFGIAQRTALSEKGEGSLVPHNLALSATPIPRTLALVMLSDLDVSVIDTLPPGRKKVSTFLVDESYRQRLEGFICKQSYEGRQVYVVCPAIENSGDEDEDCDLLDLNGLLISRKEELRLKSAIDYYHDFKTKYPHIKTAYLHGKMNAKDKDKVMEAFVKGEISVLVSTTVIEVGVNVPNATLMVVENAERFGLSQLHQLRGRVGRGEHKSWCILVSDSDKAQTKERLEALCKTNNGFEIAKEDLKLRGPGDFFAYLGKDRQHGKLSFRFAELCSDTELAEKAFREAESIVSSDPKLEEPDHLALADALSGITANSLA